MPSAYAEPPSTYLGELTAYGKGAVPSQVLISTYKQANNAAQETLTGTPTVVASEVIQVNSTQNQLIIDVSVLGNDNGAACTLIVDCQVDGVSIYPHGPLYQDAEGTTHGVTIGYQFAIQGVSAGSHTVTLLCSAAGDGTITVPAHMANMGIFVTAS